ncbi:TPA: FecR domain-containing protein [Stenotrophomonas maltophilia]|uniref:FecR domain-containing protein n=1 Tax=Stenotrophomonas maltophilia TaxID=40324 RepID=A0AAI9G0I9_STEMA|nr:FecR domain-containing protein [Stenotrophomonas maltophilia]EKT2103681.1 FecR domain-containing protein [Stenotrophomonas maltophilia]EKZ1926740.1 FecR domain-containing protein [Stenotrophomonas maltophilia]EMB2743886.1 FecR domain-containing protein [Stenotrophomonas maltophilia]MBH1413530.1 FecR domain-containing protein [Stenotrophomonas maltophilia]MBH1417240.1 FecR domain-containing protein [Stenotrophomonas maltophilia]
MTTSEPSPRQARQALRWVIQCSAGPLPERQQRTLQRWLQADPRHALAWRQQQAFWQGLDAAGPDVLAALPGLTADRQGLRPIAPQRRLPWLLASAAAVVLMVAAAPHALLLARSDLRSSDAPRVVQLEDGSTAVLDAGTALAVEFDGQRRHLRLLRGQAWFQVAHEARPFQVEAAGGQVRDIGTAFSVSMQDTTVVTQVSEGVVDVRPGDGSVQRLHAGQARVFRDGRWLQPLRQADPDAVAPWRRGEVVIDDQPAAQAIADLARYRRAPVWVLGGQGTDVRVSALFHLQQPETAIDSVAAQAGLRVQRLPGGALVVW